MLLSPVGVPSSGPPVGGRPACRTARPTSGGVRSIQSRAPSSACDLEVARPELRVPAPRDQPAALENLEVLGHRRQRHVEGRGQLVDCGVAPGQAAHDGPPRRVGQGGEGRIETLGGLRGHGHYLTKRLVICQVKYYAAAFATVLGSRLGADDLAWWVRALGSRGAGRPTPRPLPSTAPPSQEEHTWMPALDALRASVERLRATATALDDAAARRGLVLWRMDDRRRARRTSGPAR